MAFSQTPVITQIGLIAKDGDKIMNSMKMLFGMEPSRIKKTCSDGARRYYGAPGEFEATLIYYMFGDLEVEFVIPEKGPSIWQDFLEDHGEGLHHIQFAVEDCDQTAFMLSKHGIRVIQEGSSVSNIPDAKWQYYDFSPVLPLILESFDGKAKAIKQGLR